MKQILTIITLAFIMGCAKEPINENCVYDCKEFYFSETYNQFVLKCSFNDTTLQVFDFQYHDLKCE